MTPEQVESLYIAAKRDPDILGIHAVERKNNRFKILTDELENT